ncbi:hypothetical protein ABT160_33570 [Streptomyces sp. NPDC001941]|uniref:hypothetical protein n=1 Tax=Streptomyces sp. NPDC001941 TaxID=3154659 RepID=UPI00331FABA4
MGRTGRIRRRALLTGAAAGLAAGCAAPAGRPGARPREEEPPELRVRRGASATGRELLARYDAVLAAHPSLAARVGPLRDAAAAHVSALSPAGPGTSPSPSAPPTAAKAPSPAPPVAAEPGAALAELAAHARRSADAQTRALVEAPGELARLLASVAAANAAQAYLLTSGSRA